MIFRPYAVYNKHEIIKIFRDERKIASTIASAQITLLLTVSHR